MRNEFLLLNPFGQKKHLAKKLA